MAKDVSTEATAEHMDLHLPVRRNQSCIRQRGNWKWVKMMINHEKPWDKNGGPWQNYDKAMGK